MSFAFLSNLLTLPTAIAIAALPSNLAAAPPDRVAESLTQEQVEWVAQEARRQLRGCRVEGPGGVGLHTPDASGHYGALWTRDLYYMVEYAGDLISRRDVRDSIVYLLEGQRQDGCIPDRLNLEGVPIYSPGAEHKPLADYALDNGAFLALLACAYVEQSNDSDFFREVEPRVRRGLDHTRRAENGLVYNDPEDPQCAYGFTDVVQKTGHLLFCSLLYHDACQRMADLCEKNECGEPSEYRRRAESIRRNLSLLWNDEAGMFWAADQDCRQIDIWGSALAVQLGLVSKPQAERVIDFLVEHHETLVQRGQVRHLPADDPVWQKTFKEVKPGEYQNGAYWATPLAWVLPVYARREPDLASEMLKEVVEDFRQRGVHECVNGDYVKLPGFVVSITNVYALTRDRE